MEYTRRQYEAARLPDCSWTEEKIRAALAARFPGDGPIELLDLLDAWIADKKLPRKTLVHAHMLAARVSGHAPRGAGNLLRDPRKSLQAFRDKVARKEAPASTGTEG